jgi:hypothetical protein
MCSSTIATAAPGMLLGRVPTTSSYRVIACTHGPDKRRTCEGMLAALVGTEVLGQQGQAAKVTKVSTLKAGDGDTVVAVELATTPGLAAVSGSAALLHKSATLTDAETRLLRKRVRAISARAQWATRERFEVSVLQVNLDGDHKIDRVAIGTIVDVNKDAERVVVGIAVGLAGKPLELVDLAADRVQLVAAIDIDGDGRDEVLIDRTFDGSAIHYHYELMHVLAGKPLAINPRRRGSVSEGWQAYDRLEDHDHSDE